MKAGLYKRISTGEQSKYSLEGQEQELKAYCKAQNIGIFKIYQDIKGRFTFEERTGLMQLLDDIEQKRINLLLVTELDRLAGDEGILGYIKYTLKKNDVKLISISEQEKVKNEYEELIESILTAVAKFENKRKKLRCRRGIAQAKQEGKILNRIPLGYILVNKGRKDSEIKIDPKTSQIILDIFNRFVNQKESIYKIAKAYNFSKTRVKYILNNRFYYDSCFNGKHKPLISFELFNKANNQ